MLIVTLAASTQALLLPAAPHRPQMLQARARVVLEEQGKTSGQGFGTPRYAAEEERGRAALEALREASAERGYDTSLQGLQDKETPPEPTAEELNKFKSDLTLGFAGFLIIGGVAALFLGGSLWEPKGFNEDGTPPAESMPAFGFAPKETTLEAPQNAEAPSWASQPE